MRQMILWGGLFLFTIVLHLLARQVPGFMREDEGSGSYGRMVDLLLGEYRQTEEKKNE